VPANLPVRGSAREHSNYLVQTAPAPGGGLYVLIPARKAPAVLALLDSSGDPRAGWPVKIDGATSCDQLLPVADGSVRAVCTMENPEGNTYDPIAAFAFDQNARPLSGWPVALADSFATGRVVGIELLLFTIAPLGGVIQDGQPSETGGLATIAANGSLTLGVRVPFDFMCCGNNWAVGPDGIAYGVSVRNEPTNGSSQIIAVDVSGVRASWPITLDDAASGAAFVSDGRIAVLMADLGRKASRVLTLDRDGKPVSSHPLPISTAVHSDIGGCTVGSPQPPIVAANGTIFAYSELDTRIYAVDRSFAVLSGWPFDAGASLDHARPGLESEHEAGYCPGPVLPAVRADGTLYLALENGSATVGGSVVAVGPDGRVRPGWPVELKRPGAAFWSVVVGADGTAYALAFEPESGGASSATILAIAPDSTVLWSRTIINP
jgi:outer membrane protein assembly factor BamB